jgi:nucleoside 2-deoxyribosyltransferase
MIVPNSGKPEFDWRIHDVLAHRGMTRICLAGPDVFLPDALDIGRRKVELCKRHGLIGLYPLDNAIDPAANDASLTIFRGNENMIIEAETCERMAAERLASTRMPASS